MIIITHLLILAIPNLLEFSVESKSDFKFEYLILHIEIIENCLVRVLNTPCEEVIFLCCVSIR